MPKGVRKPRKLADMMWPKGTPLTKIKQRKMGGKRAKISLPGF